MDKANLQLWDDRFDGANPSPAIRQATVDQREAANPEATSWVAASAGTGKTRVLTNRLLALLLEGAEPRQILALTFTKAAAAEMADRVSEALEEWVTLSDEKLEQALFQLAGNRPDQEQMALARRLFARVLEAPGGLNIQTIHAFSQSLLGRFPIEAGVQPGFKV
ncbi:MAG: UvrD-helicase domain-containing protein, partial [Alphaproteobacteria bacterium]